MLKYSLVILLSACLSGCAQQPPAKVVRAKPSVQRIPGKRMAKAEPIIRADKKIIIPNTLPKKSKDQDVAWRWPVKGPILSNFAAGKTSFKGIDIGGAEGTPILAAGDGEVVYSGNSLRGYGNLIIIKHQKNFLSAYAHNRKNMVKEGDRVVIGQRIAEMGKTGTDKVKLHFEVRYQGKPVDPQGVLPSK